MQQFSQPATPKVKYYLSSAWVRILARIIDFILILGCCLLLALVIFPLEIFQKRFDNVHAWMYLIYGFVCCALNFVYFVLLPVWWNGKTMGLYLFKQMIVNVHITNLFVFGMLKREALLSESFIVITFIFCVVLGSLGDVNANEFFKEFIKASNDTTYSTGVTVFSSFLYVAGILFFMVVLWTCVRNKKRSIQDTISDTVTISTKGVGNDSNTSNNQKKERTKANYGLPAEIESIDLGEIDKL